MIELLPRNIDIHLASLPQEGHCGVGIYSDDVDENTWYDCTIDYCLHNPYTFKLKGQRDIVRMAQQIANEWRNLYKVEEETSTNYIPSQFKYNRGATNGKYGIFGHSFNDLFLEGMALDGNIIKLSVGS